MMHQPKNAQTDTHFYEDANLYHEADLPQTFTRFAARGGVVRVLSKTANTFAELVSESPGDTWRICPADVFGRGVVTVSPCFA